MQLDVLETSYPEVKDDVLVLATFEDEVLSPPVRYVDEQLKGFLAKQVQKKQLTGEYKQVRSYPLNGKPEWLVLVGCGKREAFTAERLRRVAGVAAKAARELGETFATDLHAYGPGTPADDAKATALGILLGLYRFTRYRTQGLEKLRAVEHVTLIDTDKRKAEFAKGLNEAIVVADAVNACRDLVNTPSKDLTPKQLASEAKRLCKSAGCSVSVWDRKDIEKKGMRALLGVGRGSDEEPQFIVIEYGPKKQKPIVLAGKGITFDTGGYNLKIPWTSMTGMKMDMGGAAAVICAMRALATLKVPQRIIGLVPAAENMISGKAQKPDDIVTAFTGKTIEIGNTDAEGRLVLADALGYAETLQPQAIIDLATLTGACMIALGYQRSGLFSRSDELARRIHAAGETSGDLVWRLPMDADYDDLVKSGIADVKNTGKDHPYAGATAGALFLQQFVEKTPFAHLDIAGPAFLNEEKEYHPKEGTGAGVRLLVELLQRWETME